MSARPNPKPPQAFEAGEQTNGRLALRRSDAARALSLSDESFDRYVRPHLRVVRLGSVRLYPVAELERWLDAEATSSPIEDVSR